MSLDDARRLACPVVSTDFTLERPLGWYHAHLDGLREDAPFAWNDATYGFWMFHRYDDVRERARSVILL
jgi:hypothetical protein